MKKFYTQWMGEWVQPMKTHAHSIERNTKKHAWEVETKPSFVCALNGVHTELLQNRCDFFSLTRQSNNNEETTCCFRHFVLLTISGFHYDLLHLLLLMLFSVSSTIFDCPFWLLQARNTRTQVCTFWLDDFRPYVFMLACWANKSSIRSITFLPRIVWSFHEFSYKN